MPIYEYRCTSCGYQNDYLQKLSEPALTDCPECGQSTFVKQVTAAGFQLKGTGWYATDFKNNGTSKAGAKKGDKGEGGKAEGGKAEGGKAEGGTAEGGTAEGSKSDSGAKEGGSSPEAAACGAGACPACT